MNTLKVTLILGTAALASANAYAGCDSAPGRVIFESKCAICHTAEPKAADSAGPNLYGVVGRPSASRPTFAYSPGLRALSVVWSVERLDQYLTDPQAMVPATYMAFTGIKRSEDRQTLLCFLAQLSPTPLVSR